MKTLCLSLYTLALLLFVATLAPAADKAKTAAAVKAAENFLLLLDTSQYAQSWDEAASLFRKQVGKEAWAQQVGGLLSAMGPVKNRAITGAEHRTQLPGAPDGEYVVITYRSSFANKASAIETITPMLDKDGQWRVSGYFIK